MTPCVEWAGYRDEKGYGQKRWKGRLMKAHRWAYEQAFGVIPEGLEIDHLCRNRSCINPAHLEAVTHQENLLRATIYRFDRCPKGHLFDEANTAWATTASGRRRRCRVCVRDYTRARRGSRLCPEVGDDEDAES